MCILLSQGGGVQLFTPKVWAVFYNVEGVGRTDFMIGNLVNTTLVIWFRLISAVMSHVDDV